MGDPKVPREGVLEFGEITLLDKSTAAEDVADDFNELFFP
jgi:hypothetical protein